jgi:hypothetical protein
MTCDLSPTRERSARILVPESQLSTVRNALIKIPYSDGFRQSTNGVVHRRREEGSRRGWEARTSSPATRYQDSHTKEQEAGTHSVRHWISLCRNLEFYPSFGNGDADSWWSRSRKALMASKR